MLNTVSSHELGMLARLSKGRSESQFLVYLLWVTPVLFSKVFVSVLNVKASVILEYSRTFRLKLYWTLWAGVINTGCNFGVRHLASLGTICPDGVKIVPACSRFAHTPQPGAPPAPAPTQHYVVPRVRGIIRFPPQPSPNIWRADQNIRTRCCQSLEPINPVCMNIYERWLIT